MATSRQKRKRGLVVALGSAVFLAAAVAQILDSRSLRQLAGFSDPAAPAPPVEVRGSDKQNSSALLPTSGDVLPNDLSKPAPPGPQPSAPTSAAEAPAAGPRDVAPSATAAQVTISQSESPAIEPTPQKPRKILPPPIGLAQRVCATRSIGIEAAISNYFTRRLQAMNGNRTIDIVDCDSTTGRFSVRNDADPSGSPTAGSAKGYSLSFEYRLKVSPNDSEHDWVICQVGGSDILDFEFTGTLSCRTNHRQASWPVRVSL
jgi:hypothetical protein